MTRWALCVTLCFLGGASLMYAATAGASMDFAPSGGEGGIGADREGDRHGHSRRGDQRAKSNAHEASRRPYAGATCLGPSESPYPVWGATFAAQLCPIPWLRTRPKASACTHRGENRRGSLGRDPGRRGQNAPRGDELARCARQPGSALASERGFSLGKDSAAVSGCTARSGGRRTSRRCAGSASADYSSRARNPRS